MKRLLAITGAFLILVFLPSQCEKILKSEIKIQTGTILNQSYTTASIEGNIEEFGKGISDYGHCWSTSSDPAYELITKTTFGDRKTAGSFRSDLSGLSPGTKYYVRAYALNEEDEAVYGDNLEIVTQSYRLPTIETSPVITITKNSAVSGGNITDDGGAPETSRGVCWNTLPDPKIDNSITIDGSGSGSFTSSITGLTCATKYYLRAYATNSVGTSYGNQLSFNTSECPIILPTVTTYSISNITTTAAQGGGNVTNDGGATVTVKGVCWSTNENPTISDNKTSDGTGTGSFISSFTGLTCGTTYYVRAYATNSSDTSYGEQVSFKTTECPAGLPVVTSSAISNITDKTAQCGGNITSDGGASVTARGVCWSTSSNPTTSESKTNDGSGTDSYTSTITGLDCNTTYYVRAYATNSAGTSYGNQVSFKSSTCPPPTVTTYSISNITITTAQGGGSVTEGGLPVTAKGVCWSTSQNPTISSSMTTDGSGSGNFTSNLSGLTCGTPYFVTAYATTSAGTTYGSQVSFSTSQCIVPPTVTTTAVSIIDQTAAKSGGTITSDGGAPVTAKGVCWSTSQNPTLTNNYTSDGTGTSSFTSNLTGLNIYTIYYVRAYATNSAGTSYGNQVNFRSSSVTDYDGNVYKIVDISTQTWMAENLKVTHYADGTAITYTEDPRDWSGWGVTERRYCWYDNSTANRDKYGGLYNWPAAMNGAASSNSNPSGVQGVCPTGWHLPSDTEWDELVAYLGGSSVAGGKLKKPTQDWWDSNAGATNESGFTALPGGERIFDGPFMHLHERGYFWSSMEKNFEEAWYRCLWSTNASITRSNYYYSYGYSVRCVKD